MHEVLTISETTMCFVNIASQALLADSTSWSLPDKIVTVVVRWQLLRVLSKTQLNNVMLVAGGRACHSNRKQGEHDE